MRKKTGFQAVIVSAILLACAGLFASCGVTVRSEVATGYDWAGTNKILVIGVTELQASPEISRMLTHKLFDSELPVERVDTFSVLDIYEVGREEGAEIIVYGELTKVDIYYPNRGGRGFSNYYPIKTIEVEVQFIETETRRKIWKGVGSIEDRAQIADEFLVNKILGRMVEDIVPQWSQVPRAVTDVPMLKLGQAAPLFEVQDLRGNPYALESDLGDQVIVLTFWSLFCEQCKDEIRILNDVQRRYDSRGVKIVAVSVEGEPLADRIRTYVDESGFKLKFLLDEQTDGEYAVADSYNVPGTPALYVIGKSGEIVYVRSGHITGDELGKVIDWALGKG